jgi:hypothetical protein
MKNNTNRLKFFSNRHDQLGEVCELVIAREKGLVAERRQVLKVEINPVAEGERNKLAHERRDRRRVS